MLGGIQRDKVGIRKSGLLHADEEKMRPTRDLIWSRAQKGASDRASRELRIEAALCIEPNLAGKDCAVMEPSPAH